MPITKPPQATRREFPWSIGLLRRATLGAAALVLAAACSLGAGSTGKGESVELAGIRLGMTEAEAEAVCTKRPSSPIIRRSYLAVDAAGKQVSSLDVDRYERANGKPIDNRYLANMTCGSKEGLTDLSFAPIPNESRVSTIRHRDELLDDPARDAYVATLMQRFGKPVHEASEKIEHSGLDKSNLVWLVPAGARDCRKLLESADEPGLSIPDDCGSLYSATVFAKGGVAQFAELGFWSVGDALRQRQKHLAFIYKKDNKL
jgi:hypothetical protein